VPVLAKKTTSTWVSQAHLYSKYATTYQFISHPFGIEIKLLIQIIDHYLFGIDADLSILVRKFIGILMKCR
jgi:hypothetical protein